MTDEDDTTGLDVPRRKLLGALGTVGITSAGAGLGTSAYFNDTESFEGNSLTAGTLNLKLAGSVAGTNSDAISIDTPSSSAIDGTTSSAFFGLSDIKPGDLAIVCLRIIIDGNPAHLKINGSVVSDENSVNEAEAAASGENDPLGDVTTSGTGELASKTDVQAFGPISTEPSSVSVEDYQTTLDGFSAAGGDGTFAGGGNVPMNVAFPESGTGYVPQGQDEAECFNPGTYCLYLAMSVDSGVGNIIQSDSLDLDLTVEAVQCRHNDDTPFDDSDN